MMRLIMNIDQQSPEGDTGVGKLWRPTDKRDKAGLLWDNIVCTFLLSPRTDYGPGLELNYDAFGLLKTAKQYKDWRLKMICQPM